MAEQAPQTRGFGPNSRPPSGRRMAEGAKRRRPSGGGWVPEGRLRPPSLRGLWGWPPRKFCSFIFKKWCILVCTVFCKSSQAISFEANCVVECRCQPSASPATVAWLANLVLLSNKATEEMKDIWGIHTVILKTVNTAWYYAIRKRI